MAGLPNITGEAKAPYRSVWGGLPTGAFYMVPNNQNALDTIEAKPMSPIAFDASRCSTIYGSSTTVTPLSLSTKFFIKY